MTATYRYSADGVKLEAKVSSGALNAPAGQPTAYAYLGSLVYTKTGGSYQLESTGFSGGRIVPGDIQHPVHYHITDHLGSVRVVAWPEEGDDAAVILEQNDYYPYGMRMNNGLTASTDNRYRFSGKEAQRLMGGSILDFGARYYNPTIARWTTIDHKAEKYYSTTPYSYCNNSPVVYVDPDGEDAKNRVLLTKSYNGKPYVQEKGSLRWDNSAEALYAMDCSEYVTRILMDDGILPPQSSYNTDALYKLFDGNPDFSLSDEPQLGDIALWKGHTGIVTDIDGEGKIKLSHARKPGALSGKNKYFTTTDVYHSNFIGFYHPTSEDTPVVYHATDATIPASYVVAEAVKLYIITRYAEH